MADARQVARWIVVDIVADILGRNRFSQSLRHNSAGESQHAKQVNDSAEPAKAEPFAGKKKLYYSARRRVILSMIRSMLLEQADQYDRLDSEQAGETLKHRLADLKLKPVTVN